MRLPNFLIIGAAKSGTTSLFNYLCQHPQIFVSPIKETNFFVYEGKKLDFEWWGEAPSAILNSITDLDSYKSLFNDVTDEIAIGEASPLYLYDQVSPENIYKHLPNVKLIAILRNPVDRAFSHYLHLLRDKREPCQSFEEAIAEEPNRILRNWVWDYRYIDMGFYYIQLSRYYALFDRSQVKIINYEQYLQDLDGVLTSIYTFLGVEDSFRPDTSFHFNVSGIPKSRRLHYILNTPNPAKQVSRLVIPQKLRRRLVSLIRDKNLERWVMSEETRYKLVQVFHDDILHLQDLIDKDLTNWLLTSPNLIS